MRMKAYKVTTTKAYSAWDQGTGYSFEGWGGNTREFEGHDIEVEIEIPDDYTVEETVYGDKAVYAKGKKQGMSLNDAIKKGIVKVVG